MEQAVWCAWEARCVLAHVEPLGSLMLLLLGLSPARNCAAITPSESCKSVGDLGTKNHPGSPRLGVTDQIHGGNPGGGESKRPSEDSRKHAAKFLFVHSWYPKQPSSNGCLAKQPFLYVMIWNHPVETTIKNWLFGVPGCVVISTEKSVQCIPVKRETTMKWICHISS